MKICKKINFGRSLFLIVLKKFSMKICKKINFGSSLFLVVLTSDGYFGNYEKSMRFLENTISGKIVAETS